MRKKNKNRKEEKKKWEMGSEASTPPKTMMKVAKAPVQVPNSGAMNRRCAQAKVHIDTDDIRNRCGFQKGKFPSQFCTDKAFRENQRADEMRNMQFFDFYNALPPSAPKIPCDDIDFDQSSSPPSFTIHPFSSSSGVTGAQAVMLNQLVDRLLKENKRKEIKYGEFQNGELQRVLNAIARNNKQRRTWEKVYPIHFPTKDFYISAPLTTQEEAQNFISELQQIEAQGQTAQEARRKQQDIENFKKLEQSLAQHRQRNPTNPNVRPQVKRKQRMQYSPY
jgi:hypothetical protein